MSFAPGRGFYPDGSGADCCLRLKFAAHEPKVIEEGIKRLGKEIARLRRRLDSDAASGTPDASEPGVLRRGQ